MIVQLQEKNKQNFHEIETYRSTLDKLQIELEEKQNVRKFPTKEKISFSFLVHRTSSNRSH